MGATRKEVLDLADFWESRGDAVEAARLRNSAEAYDVPEMSKLQRMAQALELDAEDLSEMTFADVEADYLAAGFPEITFE